MFFMFESGHVNTLAILTVIQRTPRDMALRQRQNYRLFMQMLKLPELMTASKLYCNLFNAVYLNIYIFGTVVANLRNS